MKSWSYDFRLQVAKKVTQFKKTGRKPTNASQMQTLHTNVCQYIAKLKSREDYEPILGPLVRMQSATVSMWVTIVGDTGTTGFYQSSGKGKDGHKC